MVTAVVALGVISVASADPPSVVTLARPTLQMQRRADAMAALSARWHAASSLLAPPPMYTAANQPSTLAAEQSAEHAAQRPDMDRKRIPSYVGGVAWMILIISALLATCFRRNTDYQPLESILYGEAQMSTITMAAATGMPAELGSRGLFHLRGLVVVRSFNEDTEQAPLYWMDPSRTPSCGIGLTVLAPVVCLVL